MHDEIKLLESTPRNTSNTRVLAWFGLAGSFLMAMLVLISGLFFSDKPNVIQVASAASSIFLAVISPFMILLGHNKRQEIKQTKNSS